jgi:hypothetical protein
LRWGERVYAEERTVSAVDIATIATAAVTAVGVLIGLFTFSYSVASKSRIKMSIGAEIGMHYDNSGRLILKADFVFWNERAQPGAIIEISGNIDPQEPKSPQLALYWRTLEKTDVSRGDNGQSIWWSHSVGPVYPLVVPGRAAGTSSLATGVRLYGKSPGDLGTGQNRVSLKAIVDDPKHPDRPYSFDVIIKPEHYSRFESDCREGKDATWRVRLIARRLSADGAAGTGKSGPIIYESQEFRNY